eukprot:gb/GECG01005905.1/.p1 GENE.gb/GECG01005905.1/~~gb/GECG01005905.1/.p1  ORF type:complete len:262 (+),score=12.65 gb/GECG01005905.1/:1-786(+)
MFNPPEERVNYRKQVFGLKAALGTPHLFITFSPSGLHNNTLLVNVKNTNTLETLQHFLYNPGANLPARADRYKAIADNPTVPYRHFRRQLDIFIRNILGYDMKQNVPAEVPGVYGKPIAIIGSVESQERGNLHSHLLVWLLGFSPTAAAFEKLLANPEHNQRLRHLTNVSLRASYVTPLTCPKCQRTDTLSDLVPAKHETLARAGGLDNDEPTTVSCTSCGPFRPCARLYEILNQLVPQACQLAQTSPDNFLHQFKTGLIQ